MGGGEILKKGWLTKSPPLEGSGMKSWRKRWFCLRSSKVLEYYKEEDGDRKGVINLEDCKAVNSSLSHKRHKYVFDIQTRERTFYLVASTKEEMEQWVEAICRVCDFTTRNEAQLVRNAVSLPPSSTSSTSSHHISNPTIVSAPSTGVVAGTTTVGIAFTERFKPSQEQSSVNTESLYSFAAAAEYDVQRQLSFERPVPPGTPLTEALASKGIGSVSSAASPGTPVGIDARVRDETYFSPRVSKTLNPGSNPNAVYATPHRTMPSSRQHSATLIPSRQEVEESTSAPAGPKRSNSTVASPQFSISAGGASGRTLGGPGLSSSSGGMPPRIPNYDYVSGPPRPAPESVSPHQHRSALLRQNDSDSPPPPVPAYTSDRLGTPPGKPEHSYENVRLMYEAPPPRIDRSTKPLAPTVNRSLKPGNKHEDSDSDSAGELPSVPKHRKGSQLDGEVFSPVDIPRVNSSTTCYAQVDFDPIQRRPIPLPRNTGGAEKVGIGDRREEKRGTGVGPQKRENYVEVDLVATRDLEEEAARLILQNQAARMVEDAASDKPYINISRDGAVDERSNPDSKYYTHMRNLTLEEADKPDYFTQERVIGKPRAVTVDESELLLEDDSESD